MCGQHGLHVSRNHQFRSRFALNADEDVRAPSVGRLKFLSKRDVFETVSGLAWFRAIQIQFPSIIDWIRRIQTESHRFKDWLASIIA
jgi:hypothetical protein